MWDKDVLKDDLVGEATYALDRLVKALLSPSLPPNEIPLQEGFNPLSFDDTLKLGYKGKSVGELEIHVQFVAQQQ